MMASLTRMVKSEVDTPSFEKKRVRVGMRIENQIRQFVGRRIHASAARTNEMRKLRINYYL
jgi:hypothetical protein